MTTTVMTHLHKHNTDTSGNSQSVRATRAARSTTRSCSHARLCCLAAILLFRSVWSARRVGFLPHLRFARPPPSLRSGGLLLALFFLRFWGRWAAGRRTCLLFPLTLVCYAVVYGSYSLSLRPRFSLFLSASARLLRPVVTRV